MWQHNTNVNSNMRLYVYMIFKVQFKLQLSRLYIKPWTNEDYKLSMNTTWWEQTNTTKLEIFGVDQWFNDSIEKKELVDHRVRRLCCVQHRCFGGQRFINGFFIKQKITALKPSWCTVCVMLDMRWCIVGKERGGRRIHLQMVTSHKLQQLLLSVPILLLCTGRNSSALRFSLSRRQGDPCNPI